MVSVGFVSLSTDTFLCHLSSNVLECLRLYAEFKPYLPAYWSNFEFVEFQNSNDSICRLYLVLHLDKILPPQEYMVAWAQSIWNSALAGTVELWTPKQPTQALFSNHMLSLKQHLKSYVSFTRFSWQSGLQANIFLWLANHLCTESVLKGFLLPLVEQSRKHDSQMVSP